MTSSILMYQIYYLGYNNSKINNSCVSFEYINLLYFLHLEQYKHKDILHERSECRYFKYFVNYHFQGFGKLHSVLSFNLFSFCQNLSYFEFLRCLICHFQYVNRNKCRRAIVFLSFLCKVVMWMIKIVTQIRLGKKKLQNISKNNCFLQYKLIKNEIPVIALITDLMPMKQITLQQIIFFIFLYACSKALYFLNSIFQCFLSRVVKLEI